MKNIYLIISLVFLLGTMGSCNYLDVVPDERPTEEDAFKDKKAAERYLYSCYSFMYKDRSADYIYQSGEIATDYSDNYLHGNYSASDPGRFRYWSSMYGGIKRCYTLIDNVDKVPRLEDELKVSYKAEAKFLIAYYYFCLLRAYGPVLLVDHDMDIETPANDYPKRSSYDACVDWVANLLDEAFTDLPAKYIDTEYGRATKLAAKSLKGRLLLYAASPLFNGNSEFYAGKMLDPDTKESLMNLTYNPEKWNRALEACQIALKMATDQGYGLFETTTVPDEDTWPSLTEYKLRIGFMDKTNMDVIWADTRREGQNDLQNQCAPRDNEDGGDSWNGVGPTLDVIKNFYTKNGLPIADDPTFYSPSEYFKMGKYDGENTCNLNLDREPRFYAWISFHNGWFEMQRKGKTKIRTTFRKNDPYGVGSRTRDFTKSGYLIKKYIHPNYHTQNGYTNYPWPLIRIAELYLNVAEAAAEANELTIAKTALNEVRKHAGIPEVEKSWKGIAELTQPKLIDIIRQERTIEFFGEGHYGWDIRRWKKASKILNHNPEGLNISEESDAGFFRPTTINAAWNFTSPTNYLMPIRDKDININQKIVQNPGY